MDDEQRKIYEHMLAVTPVEPSPVQLAANPYAKSVTPPLPSTLTALHERYESYFRRLYNRGLERGHLPMIAAFAAELDRMQGPAAEIHAAGLKAKRVA